jgi:hypothetical protein
MLVQARVCSASPESAQPSGGSGFLNSASAACQNELAKAISRFRSSCAVASNRIMAEQKAQSDAKTLVAMMDSARVTLLPPLL